MKKEKPRARVMITLCDEFGGKFGVSTIFLTTLCRLSQMLERQGVEVEYADMLASKGDLEFIGAEAAVANRRGITAHVVLYKDERRQNDLFAAFFRLCDILSRKIKLVLVEIGTEDVGLTVEEKEILTERGCGLLYGDDLYPDNPAADADALLRAVGIIF